MSRENLYYGLDLDDVTGKAVTFDLKGKDINILLQGGKVKLKEGSCLYKLK